MNIHELRELIRNNKIVKGKYYEIDTGEVFIGKYSDRVEFVKKTDLIKEVQNTLLNKQDKADNYKEFTFDSDGNLIKIEAYVDSSKASKTLEKTFTYNSSSNLISIYSEYPLENKIETKYLSYDGSGNITNIEIN